MPLLRLGKRDLWSAVLQREPQVQDPGGAERSKEAVGFAFGLWLWLVGASLGWLVVWLLLWLVGWSVVDWLAVCGCGSGDGCRCGFG